MSRNKGLGFGISLPKDWYVVSGFPDSRFLGGSGKGEGRQGVKSDAPVNKL